MFLPLTLDVRSSFSSLTSKCERVPIVATAPTARGNLNWNLNLRITESARTTALLQLTCSHFSLYVSPWRPYTSVIPLTTRRKAWVVLRQWGAVNAAAAALYRVSDFLPTFHTFLSSSKVSTEMWPFLKTHLKVHTGWQVGVKHNFCSFL